VLKIKKKAMEFRLKKKGLTPKKSHPVSAQGFGVELLFCIFCFSVWFFFLV